MTEWHDPSPPPSDPNAASDSSSTSDSGSGAGAGAGAIGLAGAGAIAGSGALSGSDSSNWNGNGNDNWNGNENTNTSTTSVTVQDYVTAQVTADVGPPSYDSSYDTNSFNTTSTTTTLNLNLNLTDSPINLADANNFLAGSGDNFTFSGDGTDSVFHVDQVNSLIANNTLSDVSLTDNASASFSQSADGIHGGFSGAGAIDGAVGDSVSATVSSAASATATLSAFTQNIVLGANIQYNSLSQSAIGGGVTHNASMSATTADPSHSMGGDPMSGMHSHS